MSEHRIKEEYSVIAENVTKVYKMYNGSKDRLLGLLFNRDKAQNMYALKDVSFKAKAGESIGLVGLNGSGKSTLADIIAGISKPSYGRISLNGEPAVIAVSSGLNNQLTGMENIELKGLITGFTYEQINQFKDKIIEFADIGAYINQPVKTYSSGMRSRLGFAISINIDPDIMVVDEALAVGDPSFTDKCLKAMDVFRENGKTIFFVSHNLKQMETFCSKLIWLEYGILKAYGPTEEVIPMYQRFITNYNAMSLQERAVFQKNMIENQNHFLLK
jgi:teichoic acid transport system ATP-binding protein